MIFFFSFGGLIHRYYLDLLAPPVAALSAAGLVSWKDALLAGRRSGWLLPAAVGMTALISLFIIQYDPLMRSLAWLVILLGAVAVLTLSLLRSKLGGRAMLALSLAVILLAPAVWSTTPMWKGGDVILPFAGPDLLRWGGAGGAGGAMEDYKPLADFLMQERGGERFITATENAVTAAPLQLLTRQPVMAVGGFTGADPILTLKRVGKHDDPRGSALLPDPSGRTRHLGTALLAGGKLPAGGGAERSRRNGPV